MDKYPDRIIGKASTLIAFLLLGLFLILFFRKLIFNEGTCLDDACMYIRYADNIINGYGYTWNRGDFPTYGCTSIIYTIILLVLRLFFPFLSPVAILTCCSAFFALLSLSALYYLLTCLLAKVKKRYIIIFISLLGLQPMFLYHSFTGMDTQFSFFLNTINIIVIIKIFFFKKTMFFRYAALTTYLAFLGRPDSSIVVFLTPLILVFLSKQSIKPIFCFYLILTSLLIGDFALKYYYFGDPLPLPFYAKLQDFFKGYITAYVWNPFFYLQEFVIFLSPFLIFSAYFLTIRSFKFLLLLVPVLVSIFLSFQFIQIMGDEARFYFPMVPHTLLVFGLIIRAYINEETVFKWAHLFNVALSLLILMMSVLLLELGGREWAIKIKQREEEEAFPIPANGDMRKMSWLESSRAIDQLCKKLPDNTTITGSEHGFIAAYNPTIKIVDLTGLHDRYIARKGYSENYLMSKKPTFIWLAYKDNTALNHSIVNGQKFKEKYHFIPGAYGYGIAVLKKDNKAQEILKSELKKYYSNFNPMF